MGKVVVVGLQIVKICKLAQITFVGVCLQPKGYIMVRVCKDINYYLITLSCSCSMGIIKSQLRLQTMLPPSRVNVRNLLGARYISKIDH